MATTYERYSSELRKKARDDIARRLDLSSLGAGAATYADNSRAIMSYQPPRPISPPKPSNFGDAVKAGVANVVDWEPIKFLLKTLDTPGSFVRGGVNEIVNPTTKSVLGAAGENTSNLWQGEKTIYTQDILKENRKRGGGKENITGPGTEGATAVDAIAGFVGDVLLDPLLFLGVGSLGKTVGKGGSAAEGISRTTGSSARVRNIRAAASEAYHTPNTTFRQWTSETAKKYRAKQKPQPIVPGTRAARNLQDQATSAVDNAAAVKAGAARRAEKATPPPASMMDDELGRSLSMLAPIDEASEKAAMQADVFDSLGVPQNTVEEIFGSGTPVTAATDRAAKQAIEEVKQAEGVVPEKLTPAQVAESVAVREAIKRPEDFSIPEAFRKIQETKHTSSVVKVPDAKATATADELIDWAYDLPPRDINALKGSATVRMKKNLSEPISLELSFQDAFRYVRDEISIEDILAKATPPVTEVTADIAERLAYAASQILDHVYKVKNPDKASALSKVAETPSPRGAAASLPASQAAQGWTRTLRGKKVPEGYEVLDPKTWENLRKKLTRFKQNGWLSPADFEALKSARNSMDPNAWDEAVSRIMYEGYPTPIQPAVREIADEAISPATIADGPIFADNPLLRLPEAYQVNALEAIRDTVRREFQDTAKYTQATRIPGTKVAPEEALGRNLFAFDRYSDYTLFKSIMDKQVQPIMRSGDIQEKFLEVGRQLVARGDLDPKILSYGKDKWGFQARIREQLVVPVLRESHNFLESQGIIHNLGTGMHGKPVTLTDIIESLPPGRMRDMIFHPATNVPVSNIEEAVDRILDRAIKFYDELGRMPDKNEWAEFAQRIVGYKGRFEGDPKFVSEIMEVLKKKPGFRQNGKNHSSFDLNPIHVEFMRKKLKNPKLTKEDIVNRMAAENARLLINGTLLVKGDGKNVFIRMAERSAKYGKDVHAQTDKITVEVQKRLIAALQDNAPFSVKAGALTHADDAVKEVAQASKAYPESAMRANDNVDEFIAQNVPEPLIKAVDDAEKGAAAISKGNTDEAVKTAFERQKDAVATDQATRPIAQIEDFDFNTYNALQSTFQRVTGPFFEHFAKNTYGMAEIGEAVSRFRNVIRPQRAYFHNTVAKTLMKHSAKVEGTNLSAFDNAFYAIQQGLSPDSITNPAIRAAVDDVKPLVDSFFNTEYSLLDAEQLNRFVDNGFDFDLINRAFAAEGHEYAFFDLKDAVDAVKSNQADNVAQALGSQWRGWEIADPAAFLKVSEKVLTHQIALQATVFQGLHFAEKLGHISKTPKAGFVRYVNSSRDAIVPRYIPEGTYMRKEVAIQFGQMDKVLAQTLLPPNQTQFGRFISGPFGSIMAMWKSGMTIWNPRHFFRNGVGDISLNFLAGVTNPRYYQLALKTMARRGDYGYWDGIGALKNVGMVMPKQGETLFYIKTPKGKQLPVTAETLYANLRARGALNAYPVRENLLDDMVQGDILERYQANVSRLNPFIERPGQVKDKIAKTHEWRDHFIRTAQAIHVMKKGRFNSLDDALDAAASEIRYWHPDGSDLSFAQNKYWRVAFPFYSWTRGALPLVVESFLTKPARIMVYPKAYYNIAEANGIDLQSLANPFPIDQLFPDFMTDRMTGPIGMESNGDYAGIHPGVVQDDLSNFATNPIRAALGMLGPGIKAPVELATGQNLGIDAPVADVSDYIDSQIPGVNVLASLTGYSPSGTIGNALSFGRTVDNETGQESVFDPQRNVQRGLNEPFDVQDAINWLTGLQLSNMSQENYINLAEIQARNKARREARQSG